MASKRKGTSSNDTLNGTWRKDTIHGDAGNDKIDGGKGDDKLYGDAGNDTLKGGSGNDQLYGGAGNDVIYGGKGKDKLNGDAGDDYLNGGNGKDQLYGGAGNDSLNGGRGDDALYGDAGEDTLVGWTGNDQLFGGAGNDTYIFYAGSGRATVSDTDGTNTFDFSAMRHDLTVDLSTGRATAEGLTVNFNDVQVIRGGSGTNLYIMGDGSTPVTIIGGAGDDTLDLTNVLNANLGNITVSGIENYIGGTLPGSGTTGTAGDDTFTYSDDYADETLDGLGGNDTMDFSAMTAAHPVTVTFTSDNDGTADNTAGGTITFTDVENVIGGADDDSVIFDDAFGNHTIDGGAGNDALDFSAATAGNDITVDFVAGTATNGTDTVTFSNVENVTTGDGDDSFALDDISVAHTLDGGSGSDTLDLSALDGTEDVTVDFQTGGSGDVVALNIETVTSGAGDDTFVFADGFSNVTVDGNAGTNSLDFSALTVGNNVTVDFTAGTATDGTGTITFTNVDNMVGGAGDDSFILDDISVLHTLEGGDGSDTLDLSALDATEDVTVDFHSGGSGDIVALNVETVTSGAGDDTFTFGDGFGDYTIEGGTGTNELDFSALTVGNDVTVDFTVGTATDGTGTITFINFENVIGGAGDDTFISDSNSHTLDGGSGADTLDMSNIPNGVNTIVNFTSGSVIGETHVLTNIETVVGGEGDNTFVFEEAYDDYTVTGGSSGTDTLDFSLTTTDLTVDFATGQADNTSGGTITFSGVESVTGGDGDDTFAIGDAFGTISAEGGNGSNTLDFSAMTAGAGNNMTVDFSAGTATSSGGDVFTFANMENMLGGDGDDTFSAADLTYRSLDGGGGSDLLDLSTVGAGQDAVIDFSGNSFGGATHTVTNMESVNSGDGDDVFVFGDDFADVTLDGGNGTNTLNFSEMTAGNNVTVDYTALTATNNVGAGTITFSANITDVTGGAGDDSFVFGDNYGVHTVDGDAGTDTLNLSAVSANTTVDITAGTITSGGGADVITYNNMESLLTGSGDDTFEGLGTGGFGNLVIDDAGGLGDYLDLAGFNQAQVQSWQSADHVGTDGLVDSLVISLDTGDTITIENYFDNTNADPALSGAGAGSVETFHFGDGDLGFGDITYS